MPADPHPGPGLAGSQRLTRPQPHLQEPSVAGLTHLWTIVTTHQAPGQAGAGEARPAGWNPERSGSPEPPSHTLRRLPAPGTGALGHLGRFWPPGIPWLQPRRLTKGPGTAASNQHGGVGDPTLFPGVGGGGTGCPPPRPRHGAVTFPKAKLKPCPKEGPAGKTAPPPSTENTAG